MLRWLLRALRGARLDRELDRELRFHVDSRIQALLGQGHSPAEARRLALAEFGGMQPISEATRDARGTRWITDCRQDLRYGTRVLWSAKGFTLAATLSLGVGLGANAAVFRVMDSLMLRPLKVADPHELVVLHSSRAEESRFSFPAYTTLASVTSDVPLAAFTPVLTMQLDRAGVAHLTTTQLVSGSWFPVLGVGAQVGRLLQPSDDGDEGAPPAAVISDRFWSRHFGRSDAALGAAITVNGLSCTVVGVAPTGFGGLTVETPVDVWLPLRLQHDLRHRSSASVDDADPDAPWLLQDGVSWLRVIGRIPSNRSAEAVHQLLEARYQQILQARAADMANENRRRQLLDDRLLVEDGSRGISRLRINLSPAIRILMGLSALVLLVACANLANLLLARGAVRRREFALRLALGARRGRLVRQLLTESLALAGLAAALGTLIAVWGAQALLHAVSSTATPVPLTLPVDWRVLGLGVGLTIATGLAFGVIPALRLSRAAEVDALKTGSRAAGAHTSRRRFPVSHALVATQVALSLLLLVGAALFLQTFENLLRLDPGYDRESVISARFDTRLAGFDPDQLPGLYDRLLTEARRLPGVRSAAVAVVGPATGLARISGVAVEGYEPAPNESPSVYEDYVGDAFFDTLGIHLVEGRLFDSRDTADGRAVAIVNTSMARMYFGDASAVGRGFGYGVPNQFEIVGVVADTKVNGQRDEVPALAYYPLSQRPGEHARNLYVRADAPPDAVTPLMAGAVQAAAPDLAVREIVTLGDLTERSVAGERMLARLSLVFAIIGAAVAALGLYGTIAYSVTRRTNEIGIRLALGAPPGAVRRMVLRETTSLVGIGLALGMVLVVPLGRIAEHLLFGLTAHDPGTLAAVAGAVLALGVAAGAIPAWRAARVHPTTALRAD
jgi:predicted permease